MNFMTKLTLILACMTTIVPAVAKKYTSKAYKPKAIFSGFGKQSTKTGKIKTKATRGYFKPSNGYKFVNSYARSK